MFKIIKNNKKNGARRGQLRTRRGVLDTPFFMPIATKASVKGLTTAEIATLGSGIILSNTYHLMVRPGEKLIKRAGGLHKFMNWDKAILTDSGGFQVFSLGHIRKIAEAGVTFNSHLDGREYRMRPEDSMQIQLDLGSDIMMVLDECVKLPAERQYLENSVALTTRWAERCRLFVNKKVAKQKKKPLLFGIVQGGLEKDLRIKSAQELEAIGFDGYAIGGLSVGEAEADMYKCLDYVVPALPENRPRYLMGVGRPENIINAVARGVDMFDCVIPTREARHGRLYLWSGLTASEEKKYFWDKPKKLYEAVNLKNEKFKEDFRPINKKSRFPELRQYTLSYLRHLFVAEEPLAIRLATLNNLEFYLDLMDKIRRHI